MKSRNLSALAFALVVSTTLSGTVLAADVEAYTPHDWTGLYVGGHVGYGWLDLKGSHESANPGDDFLDGDGRFKLDDDDFLAGLQLGYNWQIDNFVLGIEGDVSFVSWDDELTSGQGEQVSFDTDFLATLRARGGITMDNLLVFATAGVAWTDTNYQVDDNDGADPDSVDDVDLNDVGFVVGGGAEYAFDENWSIKAEALYLIFDKEDTDDLVTDSETGDFIKLDDLFIARIGVNFHF